MRKIKYLFGLFLLMSGSWSKRIRLLREINDSLNRQIQDGNTVSEAIDNVGSVPEIIRSMEDNDASQANKKILSTFMSILSILLLLLIITDLITLKNGSLTLHILTSNNSGIFGASKVNIRLITAKCIMECLLLIIIIRNKIKRCILNKNN